MNSIRTIAVSVAMIAAVGSLSACTSSGASGRTDAASPPATSLAPGSSTDQPAGPATTSGTTAATAGGGGPDTTTPAGSGDTRRASSGSSQCAESQLRANVQAVDLRGLNRHVVKVTFTNTSDSACTLTGYPGAAIVDDSGAQVQQAKRVIGGPVGGTIERSASLPLRPGATAYAWLEGSSTREQGAAQAGCDGAKYPRIVITPPNTRTAVPFTIGWPQCYSFDIHPVRED